ncbi:MAG: mechanosensitive ion channel [Bacilli bacterium]
MDFLLSPKFYLPILYVAIGIIVNGAFSRILKKVFAVKQDKLDVTSFNYKKAETFRVMIQNIGKYAIGLVVVLMCLTVYKVNVASIIAGLGVVGVVTGLALQDVLKDFFAGISIIMENQYAIGDNIEINGFRGEVIFLGLKSTKIRDYTGATKIIANRNISEIVNYSMENSLAIIDIYTSYEENPLKIEKALNQVIDELGDSYPKTTGSASLVGIVSFTELSVVYRITIPTKALENFQVEREVRKLIRKKFVKEKIAMINLPGIPNGTK